MDTSSVKSAHLRAQSSPSIDSNEVKKGKAKDDKDIEMKPLKGSSPSTASKKSRPKSGKY